MKYIIFDFDGTIGDSQSLIVKTLQDTMRARKLEEFGTLSFNNVLLYREDTKMYQVIF